MFVGLYILASALRELMLDPPHIRDHDAPCFTCGVKWDGPFLDHTWSCGYFESDPEEMEALFR